MTFAHWTLMALSALSLLESLWGMTAPVSLKRSVMNLLSEAPPDPIRWGWGFTVGTLILWGVAITGQRWAHRALFAIGVFFMVLALLSFRPGFVERLLSFWIVHRPYWAIRLFYAVEFMVAGGLMVLACSGK